MEPGKTSARVAKQSRFHSKTRSTRSAPGTEICLATNALKLKIKKKMRLTTTGATQTTLGAWRIEVHTNSQTWMSAKRTVTILRSMHREANLDVARTLKAR
mmetsp:Transcript_61432/g.163489  ORF Transcript_61432/g.163489 Transcript_61432/m.163489 type:complete len:101 (-) Transcript_61432:47-349(-)